MRRRILGAILASTAIALAGFGVPLGLSVQQRYRDEALVNQLQADPHSPPRYRINGPLRNLNEW